jgi:imidazolonepropionase-like amidohydrolase
MRTLRAAALILTVVHRLSGADVPVVAVKAGRLVDPAAGTVTANAVVLVEKGRVTAVGPSVAIPPGARVIDLSGMTVLPGLMDCHTHLVGDYTDDKDPLSELKSSSARRAFESVPERARDARRGLHDRARRRHLSRVRRRRDARRDREGLLPGPRMFVAGAYLTITGGGGAVTASRPTSCCRGTSATASPTARPGEAARSRHRAQGVDLIKVLATGAFLAHGSDPHAVEYGYDEMRAAVEEAAHKG